MAFLYSLLPLILKIVIGKAIWIYIAASPTMSFEIEKEDMATLPVCTLHAQEEKSEQIEWIKKGGWKIPAWVKIHVGKTINGFPKYWIKSRGLTIYVSPEVYERYKKEEVDLYVVKWKHLIKNVKRYNIAAIAKEQD